MSKTAGFIFGFFTAGIAVLLTTPMSGKTFRRELNDRKKRLISSSFQLKKDVTDIKNNLVELTSSGKETIKGVAVELKKSFDDWKEDIDPNLKQLQHDFEILKAKAEKAAKNDLEA